jgi:hypothetical protein
MIKRPKSPLPPFSKGEIEEPPPVLGTWRALYVVVLGELAVLILLFYALTRWAS